jgi:hypothetical protein
MMEMGILGIFLDGFGGGREGGKRGRRHGLWAFETRPVRISTAGGMDNTLNRVISAVRSRI